MASGTCGDNLTWTFENGTLTISGRGKMKNYLLNNPAPWYHCSASITKVVIKDGVTTIGNSAFLNYYSLTAITIPEGVTTIGYDAFYNCCSLTAITIPEGVTTIGNYAFSHCGSLTAITIPNTVIELGDNIFCNCKSLTAITIPEGVTTIGDCAFWGCSSLTAITIPEGVTTIGYDAFSYCSSLTAVTILEGVTTIGDGAFSYCSSLTTITILEGVTTIGYSAFWDCHSLTAITIPEGVTEIGNEAFKGCESLTAITIPDTVIELGDNIFRNCKCLQKIYYRVGSGFESKLSMGNNAELIPVTPKIPAWKVENITLTIGGTDKIKDYSKETPPWHDYLKTVQRIVIEDGVKEISANAFSNILRLEHVTIPASVKTIGDMAFTISHCGERTIDGGKNVIWSLERGILVIKKNPAAKADADFSTGYESWNIVEKNFKAIKIECGIIPSRRFFEWLWQSGRDVQIKFV